MADVTISYNNSDIAEISDDDVVILDTNGKYMIDDIAVRYTKPKKIIKGSFTAGSAATVQTINIPYSGNGYPVLISCVVKGGTGGAEPYNSVLKAKNAGIATLIKANPDLTPTFSTGAANSGVVFVYCRTSSTAGGGTTSFSVAYDASTDPSGTSALANIIKVNSKTSFKIYIASGQQYGFYPGQEYDYWVVYSE